MTTKQISFYQPDAIPEYGNESDYILLLKCSQEDVPIKDIMTWGMWFENEWWIVDDELICPVPDDGFIQEGERREVVPFQKLAEVTFYSLVGWCPIHNGSRPSRKKNQSINIGSA